MNSEICIILTVLTLGSALLQDKKEPPGYPTPIAPKDSLIEVFTNPPKVTFAPKITYQEGYRPKIKNTLWLQLLNDSTGTVQKAEVARSTDTLLNDHAVRLGYLHQFAPAELNGRSISIHVHFPIRFKP